MTGQTVSIFQNRSNQAIRIPKDMSYEGVHELDIQKIGDVIVLRPVRPSWESFFTDLEPLDAHDPFIEELSKRRPVIARDRVTFDDETSEQ